MNRKEAVAKVVQLMTEVDSINDEIREILDECKTNGHDPAIIKAVASSVVKASVDKLQNKSELILEAIQDIRS